MAAVILLLAALIADTQAATRYVLRVERDLPEGKVQQALIFDEGSITLSRNSNFLCPESNPVRLGVFESKNPEKLKTARELVEQIATRVDKREPGEYAPAPGDVHGLRIFLGDRELSGDRDYGPSIRGMVEEQCAVDPDAWKPKDAAAIQRGLAAKAPYTLTEWRDGTGAKPRALSSECTGSESRVRCVLPEWGTALFPKP